MKRMFPSSIFVILAFLTFVMASQQLTIRKSSSLTISQHQLTGIEFTKNLELDTDGPSPVLSCVPVKGLRKSFVKVAVPEINFIANPTLNFLYRAHSPPALS